MRPFNYIPSYHPKAIVELVLLGQGKAAHAILDHMADVHMQYAEGTTKESHEQISAALQLPPAELLHVEEQQQETSASLFDNFNANSGGSSDGKVLDVARFRRCLNNPLKTLVSVCGDQVGLQLIAVAEALAKMEQAASMGDDSADMFTFMAALMNATGGADILAVQSLTEMEALTEKRPCIELPALGMAWALQSNSQDILLRQVPWD